MWTANFRTRMRFGKCMKSPLFSASYAMLHLHHFTFNPFQENTWLIWADNLDCFIIDPGCYSSAEKQILKRFIETNSLNPIRLINTHCHIDHVLGNPFVHMTYGLSPEIHSKELSLLLAVEEYGKMWGIQSEPQPEPILSLDSLEDAFLGDERIQLLFTPGHSPGEICLYSETSGFVIAGDVLFQNSIGRTDLPGGNMDVLLNSIRTQLFTLPDTTQVHCGHGNSTQIGYERLHNPFLR